MSVVLDGPITSSNIHRKLCKLAQVVQLDNFLTENSQEDDYMMVLEEAISKIQRLSSSASEQAQQLEQMKTAKKSKKDHVILEKSKKVEDELLNTLQQVEGRNEWYEKYKRLGNKLKKERAQNSVLEEFVQGQNKKIAVLVDHTEKLMKALKLENTKRMKTLDETRKIQKEELTLREKIDKQARVNQAQQRAIKEVTEGSKVLEDQLHLMDEKYLELRSKLDLTRDHLHKQIDKVKKECTELRKKYTVATGGGLLDKIQMPNNHIEMTDMDDHRKRRESRGSDGKNSKGHTNWSNQSFILDQSSVPIRNSPSQDKNDMLGGMGLRRPSVDMSEIEAIKQRMNRSKSVDFSPVALQSSNYNTTIQVTRSPAQANMQQTFMNEIKVGLPPQAAFQVTPINTSSNTLTNASNNNSGSNLRAPTPLSMRPTSALNSPQRRSNNNSPPSRPQSAAALGNNYSGMPKGMSDRILTHVVRKIQRKDGGTKKHGWTADRIHELLEG